MIKIGGKPFLNPISKKSNGDLHAHDDIFVATGFTLPSTVMVSQEQITNSNTGTQLTETYQDFNFIKFGDFQLEVKNWNYDQPNNRATICVVPFTASPNVKILKK